MLNQTYISLHYLHQVPASIPLMCADPYLPVKQHLHDELVMCSLCSPVLSNWTQQPTVLEIACSQGKSVDKKSSED